MTREEKIERIIYLLEKLGILPEQAEQVEEIIEESQKPEK